MVFIVYFYLTNSLNRFDFKISFDVFYYFILMLILAIAASSYAFLFWPNPQFNAGFFDSRFIYIPSLLFSRLFCCYYVLKKNFWNVCGVFQRYIRYFFTLYQNGSVEVLWKFVSDLINRLVNVFIFLGQKPLKNSWGALTRSFWFDMINLQETSSIR